MLINEKRVIRKILNTFSAHYTLSMEYVKFYGNRGGFSVQNTHTKKRKKIDSLIRFENFVDLGGFQGFIPNKLGNLILTFHVQSFRRFFSW